jgi:outer membrane murein-binding lipoprotein Lpp
MNKKILTTALAAVLMLAGCANGNTQQTTTAASAQTTTEAAAQTTEAMTTTAAPETTAAELTTADSTGKTVIFTDFQGNAICREDCDVNDWGQLTVPYAYAYLSSGMYFDSEKNPDLFTPDEFSYTGERAGTGALLRLEAGMNVGGVTIASASTTLSSPWDDAVGDVNPNAESGFTLSGVHIDLDGEVTLTGTARLYYDELYAVSSGDIVFIPDSCYAGLPIAADITNPDAKNGTLNFDEKGGSTDDGGYADPTYGGGLCVYSDAPLIHAGNLMQDYSDRADLYEFFDGAAANCTKQVEITLTNVHIEWNDNFGAAYGCSAVIKDVKTIG